jgi:hypothetical protein
MLAQRISSTLTMKWPRSSTHAQLCMKALYRVAGFIVGYFALLPLIPLCLLFFWILCCERFLYLPRGPYPWRCSAILSLDIHSSLSLVSIFWLPIRFPFLLSSWEVACTGYFPAQLSFTPTHLWRWNRQSVQKRWLLIFRRRGNTQKKIYLIYNTAKVWKLL